MNINERVKWCFIKPSTTGREGRGGREERDTKLAREKLNLKKKNGALSQAPSYHKDMP